MRTRSYITLAPTRIHSYITGNEPDNHIIAAAVITNALCIVSGDRDLTRFASIGGVPILTPRQFLEIM